MDVKAGLFLLVCVCLVGCGDSRDSEGSHGVTDATGDVSPQGINFYEPESVSASCPGIKENPNFPSDYQLVCETFFAENPDLEQASACVHLEDQPDAICYCKTCAVKGIEKICIKELCN
jgi:hypothetical protein